MKYNIEENIDIAKNAALEAGYCVISIYHSAEIEVEQKNDLSPLTLADKKSHEIITQSLGKTKIPVLSEEGKNELENERRNWTHFWLVDPLDGTREFINRNGEFTINIALMINNVPVAGVVYAPVIDKLYYATGISEAYKLHNGERTKLPLSAKKNWPNDILQLEQTRIVASRSHTNEETENFISQFPNPFLQSMGSSLKFMLLAEGAADIYPRMGTTMEWDTAASHAILTAVNKNIYNLDYKTPLSYNKASLKNPFFVAF